MPKPDTCDGQRVQQFLNGSLVGEELEDFERHLDDCRKCQHDLHEQSADATWWKQAGEFLSTDTFDRNAEASGELAGSVGTSDPNDSGSAARSFAANDSSYTMAADDKDPFRTRDAATSDYSQAIGHDGLQRVLQLLSPSEDPHMLGRIGRYEIVGAIGFGGMAIVLKGFEPSLNRFVAIKVLAPHLASSGIARRRFSREARAAASVLHPNVIAIHSVSEHRGVPYLVMPYVSGGSLQDRLDDRGALDVESVVRIGMQIAAGLAAAHEQGLVHRDIKPANILLEPELDRVVITDFGLARAADDASITQTGILAGTPHFMSPEQARGDRVDHRSDLFSLGSLLYTMATGRVPFLAETSYGVLRRITDHAAPDIHKLNSRLPAWLGVLIRGLHRVDVDQRFQSASEVNTLLSACLASLQNPGKPIPDRLQPTRSRRNRIFVALAVLVMVGAAFWISDVNPFQSTAPATATGKPDDEAAIQQPFEWPDGARLVTITGRFVFEGEVPERKVILPSRDVSVFTEEILDEARLVDPENFGIANVFVWLEGDGEADVGAGGPPQDAEALRFEAGRIMPRAFLLRAGQELRIGNRDAVRHIVDLGGQDAVNIPGGEQAVRRLSNTVDPVPVRCEFHPWINSHMLVLDHTWAAVSSRDGSFRIEEVPAGSWTVRLWHESVGNIEYVIDRRGFAQAWPGGRHTINMDVPQVELGEMTVDLD